MKRSSLQRKTGLKRTGFKRKPPRPTDKAIIAARMRQREDFKEEARSQRVCAVCGEVDSFDGHHVVELNWLKANGKPWYMRPNALRLCDRFSKNKCHEKHTNGSRKVKLKELTDDNINYAFAVMGAAAEVYLHRHYDGKDPRVDELAAAYE